MGYFKFLGWFILGTIFGGLVERLLHLCPTYTNKNTPDINSKEEVVKQLISLWESEKENNKHGMQLFANRALAVLYDEMSALQHQKLQQM